MESKKVTLRSRTHDLKQKRRGRYPLDHSYHSSEKKTLRARSFTDFYTFGVFAVAKKRGTLGGNWAKNGRLHFG